MIAEHWWNSRGPQYMGVASLLDVKIKVRRHAIFIDFCWWTVPILSFHSLDLHMLTCNCPVTLQYPAVHLPYLLVIGSLLRNDQE
jgi:hypothetical protein